MDVEEDVDVEVEWRDGTVRRESASPCHRPLEGSGRRLPAALVASSASLRRQLREIQDRLGMLHFSLSPVHERRAELYL